MARKTQLIRNGAYDEIASKYQLVQIDALNEALKNNGIDDGKTREQICAEFAFAIGNFHDQYWLMGGGKPAYPLLCFSNRFLNTDTDVDKLGEVLAPSESFAFHESAPDNVDNYFHERGESAKDIISGIVGFEISEKELRRVQKWLAKPMSVEEAKAYLLDKDERDSLCWYPGTWLNTFEQFILSARKPEDEIWWYNSDAKAWENLRGEQGIALVRDGHVVSFMVVGRS